MIFTGTSGTCPTKYRYFFKMSCSPELTRGGRLVRMLHIARWWVGHAFKSEMVSDTIWVGVLTILNDQNGIFYLKMPFFTKNLPIFTKKLQFFC